MVLGPCACCAGMLHFWVILCGICVALALWVGALYSDDCRLNTKLSEYEVWLLRGPHAVSGGMLPFLCWCAMYGS